MKKLFTFALIVLLGLACISPIYANSYDPPEDIYIADYSNVIDTDVENHIITTGQKLYDKTGAQVVVVTVDFANGDLEDLAYKIFNDWGIGDPNLNNGILILMSIGDQDAWVLQGAGLERDLPSSEITNMMDTYLADYFFSGDYSRGAKSIFDAFTDWLCSYYGVSLDTTPDYNAPTKKPTGSTSGGNSYKKESSNGISIWSVIIIVIIILLITKPLRKKRNYSNSGYNNRNYYRRNNYNSYDNSYNNSRNTYGSNRSYGSSNRSTSSRSSSRKNSFGGGGSRGGGGGFSSSRSSSRSSSSRSVSRSSSSRSSSSRSSSFGGGKSRGGGGGFGKR